MLRQYHLFDVDRNTYLSSVEISVVNLYKIT